MKAKVFIDGSEGTTGLRIYERFQARDDIELLHIDPALRKDPQEKKRLIHQADVVFLCLPDEAARESAALAEGGDAIVIDASTAHRTEAGWAYGFPELSPAHRAAVAQGRRIAVPGCYATGFLALVYPLAAGGILPADYPVSCFGISGYSGAGKKAIAAYESPDRPRELSAGREYALTQQHKHLKEMQRVAGLARAPLFSPIIDDYYSGMLVTVPLYAELLAKPADPDWLLDYYAEYYKGQRFIQTAGAGDGAAASGFLAGNGLAGWDGLKLYVTGNKERLALTAQFDNLGKGASGAAIQCMNLVLGCGEAKGLNL